MTTATTAQHVPDWYRGFRSWASGRIGVGAVLAYAIEMIAAGTVAADAAEAELMRPFNKYFDVTGDGVRGDAKRALHRRRGYVSFGVPESGVFDTAEVDEILLVWVYDEDINMEHHEYRPDGSVAVTIVTTPTAIWRIPAATANELMRVTGRKPKWGGITYDDLAPFLIRGAWPPAWA